jgi:Flp pilus assembly protein TadD
MASLPPSLHKRALSDEPPAARPRRESASTCWPVGLILSLALTGFYLAGPARLRMDSRTAMVVLLHLAIGLLAAPALLWAGIRYGLSRRSGQPGLSEMSPASRWSSDAAWLLAPVVVLTGIGLIAVAIRGGAAGGVLLVSHVVAGVTVVGLFLAAAMGRQTPLRTGALFGEPLAIAVPPPDPSTDDGPLAGGGMTPRAALAAALTLLFLAAGGAAVTPEPALETEYQPDRYYENLTVTNARQARNPLFPAGTRVDEEPAAHLRPSSYCGQAGCHPQAYQEWSVSAHQRACLTPGYQRLVDRCVRQRGSTARRWCDGCHGPAGLVTLKQSGMSSDLQPHPAPPDLSSSTTAEGVNCVTCHGMSRLTELSGNGRVELRLPGEYPFVENADPRLRWLHRFLIHLRPGPHRWAYFKQDLHPRSEACVACHRTSYNVPQNGFKFLRTADDYGTWLAGSYSGQSVHGFARPVAVRRCQDCHSPHGGGIRVSRSTSVQGTSIGPEAQPPLKYGSPGHPNCRKPEDPKFSTVTVDLLALRRQAPVAGAPEELIAPLERSAPLLQPGETVRVDVVVRNRNVGHAFPGGSGDLRGGWVAFTVSDASGRPLLRSGSKSPGRGDIAASAATGARATRPAFLTDPGEHTYGLIAVDRRGRRLERGDLWEMVTPLYYRTLLPGQSDADRRTIQPGESDVVRYRLRVPDAVGGRIELRAQLWCGALTSAAAGLDPAAATRLVAEDSVTLPVAIVGDNGVRDPQRRSAGLRDVQPPRRDARGPGRSSGYQIIRSSALTPGVTDPALPERFYDYGVALLLQGDLPRSQGAMRRVQAWAPADTRGYFGLGRVYLTEGDLLAARAQFELARRLAPNDPRPRAYLALTERRMGQYGRALQLLQPLVRAYPRDRLLWFDIGMSDYLAGRYEEGAQAFETMLGIDPDDLAGHYNLMRCLRRLRRVQEAQREEVIYQALREDDDVKPIALGFLHRHPWADRETRTIHEHPLHEVTRHE